jgi:hypothetical protein
MKRKIEESIEDLENIKEKENKIEELINYKGDIKDLLHPAYYNKINEKRIKKLLQNLDYMVKSNIFDKNNTVLFSESMIEGEIAMYIYPQERNTLIEYLEFLNDSKTKQFTLIIPASNGCEEIYEYSKVESFIKDSNHFKNFIKIYNPEKYKKINQNINSSPSLGE